MAKALIDIDEELLAKARVTLGTTTKQDTVNQALADVVARHARAEEVTFLTGGGLSALADPAVRRAAWR